MVDYNAPLFQHPQETWDKKKCDNLSRRRYVDGYGMKHHRRGYIGCATSCPPSFGEVRYNGGCVRNDVWWQGENRPLPIVAEGFEIVYVLTWGWYIQRKKGHHN